MLNYNETFPDGVAVSISKVIQSENTTFVFFTKGTDDSSEVVVVKINAETGEGEYEVLGENYRTGNTFYDVINAIPFSPKGVKKVFVPLSYEKDDVRKIGYLIYDLKSKERKIIDTIYKWEHVSYYNEDERNGYIYMHGEEVEGGHPKKWIVKVDKETKKESLIPLKDDFSYNQTIDTKYVDGKYYFLMTDFADTEKRTPTFNAISVQVLDEKTGDILYRGSLGRNQINTTQIIDNVHF